MIRRIFDSSLLNEVINHPDIFPFVMVEDWDAVDMSIFFDSPNNICLMSEGGGFVAAYVDEGIYEVHSLFLPNYRGSYAIRMAKEGIAYMFDIAGAKRLIGYTPVANKAARRFNRLVGMKVKGLTVKQFTPDGPAVECEECYLENM